MQIKSIILFIMKKCGNNNGFTYMELVVAVSILTIIAIPILDGFHQVSLNDSNTKNYYFATELSQNLLVELNNEISTKLKNNVRLSNKKLYDFLGYSKAEFEEKFSGTIYHYNVYIKKLDDANVDTTNGVADYIFSNHDTFLESSPFLNIMPSVSNNSNAFYTKYVDKTPDLEVVYDNFFFMKSISDDRNIHFDRDDKTCTVNLNNDGSNKKLIFTFDCENLNTDTVISIINNSQASIVALVSMRAGNDIYNEKLKINTNNTSTGKITISKINKVILKDNYVIRIDTLDKNGKQLKQLIDLYSFDYK